MSDKYLLTEVGVGSTQNDLYYNIANLVKECKESNAPPIQCELSISTELFLNNYDDTKRKLCSVVNRLHITKTTQNKFRRKLLPHDNRLHNTKTRQNTFNIILWRLLSKKASKFRSRISNLVPFLDDHMQTEHSTTNHLRFKYWC